MILGLKLKHLPLDTLKMRHNIKQTIFLCLTEQLLQQINIHLQPHLNFLIVMIFLVDFSELTNDIEEELFTELTGSIFDGFVQVDKELNYEFDDLVVDFVVFDNE